ncbi:YbaK/EbsC family protein [Nonomuraea salmonea]|uniref:YbaK/EbsC family protein n=1 Tax=Nonomuraea salmonea TaxID=46181 RepID=A0ABV5P4I4_9ACTN
MTLQWVPATGRPDLLAGPVTRAVADLEGVEVAEIDPELADTAAFCERYGVSLDESANCVVVAAKRGGETRYAACMVLATMRVDVNGVVRRHLDARKTSFAPMADAVERTGMEYGGITPLGLPEEWPVLVDTRVAEHPRVVIGSGVRRSKLAVPGATLAGLKKAEVLSLAG